MPIARFIAKQLSHPQGGFGRRVMVHMLNRGNEELISTGLALLELQASDTFLDLGFGGGISLHKASRVITEGKLVGIDRAVDMVEQARERFSDLVARDRLSLMAADVASLPLPDASVDKLLTTNTVYFWPDTRAGLAECVRVLAPGGRIAVGISGADKMRGYGPITAHGFTFYRGPELAAMLRDLGLENARAVALHGRHTTGDFVIVGDKAAL